MKSICIFCASSIGNNPLYVKIAKEVGQALARQNIALVYGGAAVGLMGAVADGALAEGGRVIGVLPDPLFGKEIAHPGLTELHRVASMHERKTLMYELSDGFIALPGGLGTLEEIFEVITWAQLGLHRKPCGFLDVGGYYDDLVRFMDRAVVEGFVKEEHRRLVFVEKTLPGLLSRFQESRPVLERWIEPEET